MSVREGRSDQADQVTWTNGIQDSRRVVEVELQPELQKSRAVLAKSELHGLHLQFNVEMRACLFICFARLGRPFVGLLNPLQNNPPPARRKTTLPPPVQRIVSCKPNHTLNQQGFSDRASRCGAWMMTGWTAAKQGKCVRSPSRSGGGLVYLRGWCGLRDHRATTSAKRCTGSNEAGR